MADTQVLFALIRKYAAMLGQLRKCQDHPEQLWIDLAHVEATFRLFRVDRDADGVKAKGGACRTDGTDTSSAAGLRRTCLEKRQSR